MDEKVIDRLFSKTKIYYNGNIHANLMTKIHSKLLDISAERLFEHPEYLIQSTMSDFLNSHLRNTEFVAKTEVNAFGQKRIDVAVVHQEKDAPFVFYELKTYIKTREIIVKEKDIYQDIVKLAIKKKELPYCRAYMLIAGKTKVLKKALLVDKTLLLPEKFTNPSNRAIITHDLSFFEAQGVDISIIKKAKSVGIDKITISLSRWKNYDGMAVVTWRINRL
jgi:hypothetical protein